MFHCYVSIVEERTKWWNYLAILLVTFPGWLSDLLERTSEDKKVRAWIAWYKSRRCKYSFHQISRQFLGMECNISRCKNLARGPLLRFSIFHHPSSLAGNSTSFRCEFTKRAFKNTSKDHVVFFWGIKKIGAEKKNRPKKKAPIEFQESHPIQFPHDQKNGKPKEFQPRVEKLHVFCWFHFHWFDLFLREVFEFHHWVLRKTLPETNIFAPEKWRLEDYFLLGRYILGRRTVSFRRCIRKPNHWEFHGIPSKCFPSQVAIVTTTMTNYIFSRGAVLGLGEHSSISYLHFWI